MDGMWIGATMCGEEELVRQVHTLFGLSTQVVYELQVQEEVEGVRQEVREGKKGEQGEEKRSHEHGWDEWQRLITWATVRVREMWRANTQEETEHARSQSDVEVSESGRVVIGVRIVQCHHAIMDNS